MSRSSAAVDMAPLRRRRAVATILARGVLRRRHAAKATACSPARESADSLRNCLGTADTSRPCVPAGSGGYGSREPQ